MESFNFLQKIKNGMKQLDICEKWVYYDGIRNGFPEYSKMNVRGSHYHAQKAIMIQKMRIYMAFFE